MQKRQVILAGVLFAVAFAAVLVAVAATRHRPPHPHPQPAPSVAKSSVSTPSPRASQPPEAVALFPAKAGAKYGYTDVFGAMIIKPRFMETFGFSDGRAAVSLDYEKCGYIDKTGTMVVKSRFADAGNFSQGLAPASLDGYQYGFIDASGTMVIEPQFKYAESFSEGRARVQGFVRGPARGQWGYIDASGTSVIEPQFSDAAHFSQGLAAVELNGESCYIDKTGAMVWPAPKAEVLLPAAIATTRLAFVRGGDIWTIAANGSRSVQITRGGTQDTLPAWASDGRTIAFVRSTELGEKPAICLVPAKGGSVRTLLRDSAPGADYWHVGGLAYAPDGRQLAFSDTYGSTTSNAQHRRVISIDLASGETTVLLERAHGFGGIDASWGLSWSPDGTMLLISQGSLDAEGGQTWRFGLTDGGLHRLPIDDASDAAWSPDGRSILVSPFTQSRSRILIARTDGQVIRTLARGGGWEGAPSVTEARVSADGTWIAFTRNGNGVWLMKADGSAKHGLTSGSLPAWP